MLEIEKVTHAGSRLGRVGNTSRRKHPGEKASLFPGGPGPNPGTPSNETQFPKYTSKDLHIIKAENGTEEGFVVVLGGKLAFYFGESGGFGVGDLLSIGGNGGAAIGDAVFVSRHDAAPGRGGFQVSIHECAVGKNGFAKGKSRSAKGENGTAKGKSLLVKRESGSEKGKSLFVNGENGFSKGKSLFVNGENRFANGETGTSKRRSSNNAGFGRFYNQLKHLRYLKEYKTKLKNNGGRKMPNEYRTVAQRLQDANVLVKNIDRDELKAP